MAQWIFTPPAPIVTPMYFDEPSNACWFANADGEIGIFTVVGQRFRALGAGWPDAVGVVPAADGLTVLVATSGGEVLGASLEFADRPDAAILVDVGTRILAVSRLVNGDLILLVEDGSLRRLDSRTGAIAWTSESVEGATLMTVDEPNSHVYLIVPAQQSKAIALDIIDGSAIDSTVLPTQVVAIATFTGSPGLVAADDTGKVALYTPGGVDSFFIKAPLTTALCCWYSVVFAAVGAQLHVIEWGTDVDDLPVTLGLDPIVRSGWTPVTVDYPAAGLSIDDIDWFIDEGPFVATVSLGRNPDSWGLHEIRVIGGPDPQECHLLAVHTGDGRILVNRRVRILGRWPDEQIGPPVAVTGSRTIYPKPGWGGGPAGPQNVNKHPAPEEYAITVVVFRIKGSTSTVNATQRVSDMTDFVIGGGVAVDGYYREVSYRNTAPPIAPTDPKGTEIVLLGNSAFGPIDVPYSWGELFEPIDASDQWSAWGPKNDTWEILAGTFSTYLLDNGLADIITKKAQSIVMTVLPASDNPVSVGGKTIPSQWVWAYASDAQVYWKDEFSATFTRLPAVIMPAAQPMNLLAGSRWSDDAFVSTIVHELGHNLGCPDLYGDFPEGVEGREVESWDIMATDAPLGHFSLAHRMRLGWINPAWIEVCDFGQNPSSRDVVLQAIETLDRTGPPSGVRAGVEVRLRDGWNYYFEYRRKQPGKIGDQHLPANRAILGTDVFSGPDSEIERPLILKLPNDADGDGPELTRANQDYEESDVTNPHRMNDFRLTRKPSAPILSPDPNVVTVHIEYVGARRPELQVRPAPGRGNFKSPDIRLDGPAGPDIVVKGKENTIRVLVRNRGSKGADQVKVRLQWLPFTTSPGTWNPLSDPQPKDIPAHSERWFETTWKLPPSVQLSGVEVEHFCVRADVDRYIDPLDPAGSEIVVFNNGAQSNFSTSAVGHGSPSARRMTVLNATNRLDTPAVHHTVVEQTSDHFRTFLDHSWRLLMPGETDVTAMWYESLAGDPVHGNNFELAFGEAVERGLFTDLSARTFVMPKAPFDGPLERWGAGLRVQAGIRTFIDRIELVGEIVRGEVFAGDPAAPDRASGGRVRLAATPADRPDIQHLADGQVDGNGDFMIGLSGDLYELLGGPGITAQVYYHGSAKYVPCVSSEVFLRF